MKLINKNEEFEVEFARATPAIRKEIVKILKKAPLSKEGKLLAIQKKLWQIAIDGGNADAPMEQVLTKALKEGKITKDEFYTMLDNDLDEGIAKDLLTIDLFKVIINQFHNSKEEQKLINSKADGEFWQNQDILEMENAVNSFRSAIRE